MFNNWLRKNPIAMWLLTVVRVYLGYTWLKGGINKWIGGFDAGGFLKGAIAKASGEHPTVQDWWAAFLKHGALPGVKLFNILIPLGETLVGLALLLGTFATFAALMGMVMNFAFLLSGSISVNPQMILLEMFLVVAAANAGRIGLDYWMMPYLRSLLPKKQTTPASTPQKSM